MSTTNLNAIVTVRVTKEFLKSSTVQKFLYEEFTSIVFCNTNALQRD